MDRDAYMYSPLVILETAYKTTQLDQFCKQTVFCVVLGKNAGSVPTVPVSPYIFWKIPLKYIYIYIYIYGIPGYTSCY